MDDMRITSVPPFKKVSNRDEFECQVYWCNVLHPSINQSKFTKEEDSKLIKLARKYKDCSWENIAKELNVSHLVLRFQY